MHAYTTNSPEAVSRILALTMIVDGHLSPSEVHAMHRAEYLEQVGIDDDTFDATLRTLCEDLLDAAANRLAHRLMASFFCRPHQLGSAGSRPSS